MITFAEGARMRCDEEGCDASQRVELVLLPTGGFGLNVPKTSAGKWQVLASPASPGQPYLARCPAHARTRIVTPQEGLQ
jgi:hypothetical protein